MKTQILVLSTVLMLAACVSPQERAAINAEKARLAAQEAIRLENERKFYCAHIGAPEGSPNYYDCRISLEQMAVQKQIADRQSEDAEQARAEASWQHYEEQREAEKLRKELKKIREGQ